MQLLRYPPIDVNSTFDIFDTDTWRCGVSYVRECRVLSCVWDPKLHRLFGAVGGSHDRIYTTSVQLVTADIPLRHRCHTAD